MKFERQKHYNKKLKVLYDDGDTGKEQHVHNASAILNRMTDLESKLARTRTNIDQLHENQEEDLAAVYNVSDQSEAGSCVSLAISTTGGSTISAETVTKLVVEGMALAIKEFKSELTTSTNRNPHDKVWKQWKL